MVYPVRLVYNLVVLGMKQKLYTNIIIIIINSNNAATFRLQSISIYLLYIYKRNTTHSLKINKNKYIKIHETK